AEVSGGVMCPSYMATRDEKDTTRARANVLRELLTRQGHEKNVFAKKELAEVMDLCLSCKGCASECPSNVDMALLKAEYLYQRQRVSGVPFKAKFFGNISTMNALATRLPGFSNLLLQNKITSGAIKKVLGIAPERSFPKIEKSLKNWFRSQRQNIVGERGKVLLFCDEFTNHNDTEAGKKAILLLQKLGYAVEIPAHFDSGRAQISKGLLLSAKKLAEENLRALEKIVTPATPLVGLEPSAVLTFRDEYPKLVNPEFRKRAQKLAENVFLLEEFLCREVEKGNIKKDQFSGQYKKIYLHGHCHQKALASVESTARILSLPENFHVELIPSGCCGMAGSFGYEKEHYEVSMKIGELVLFPAVRKAGENDLIAAPGTSCRHQILDGAGRTAYHPAEILFDALL
ncbi:MAG TPA: 4Fe-4S dicluster domain-containing protein, partial [Saprospiraceae bacterium]|nr:4Fe-4S dicluster domain-containing protein [Saprospiraceae bacterium]